MAGTSPWDFWGPEHNVLSPLPLQIVLTASQELVSMVKIPKHEILKASDHTSQKVAAHKGPVGIT